MKQILEDEKKKRDQIAASKKGLESNIDNLVVEIDALNSRVEEQQKTIRKQTVSKFILIWKVVCVIP